MDIAESAKVAASGGADYIIKLSFLGDSAPAPWRCNWYKDGKRFTDYGADPAALLDQARKEVFDGPA